MIQNISVRSHSVTSMTEIRGVWIASQFNSPVLTSKSSIKKALDFLEESGFNTLFVAVWNQGYTAFESEVMAKHDFPKQDPKYVHLGIDPLQEVINQAKGRNLAVFPWFEYGFAASPKADGGHILTTKPQWSAIDQSGNKVKHGGLTWMNSLNKEVQKFMTDLILEVLDKYGSDIVGVQGCDRLPAMPHIGGYDVGTKQLFKEEKGFNPPNNTKDKDWVKFRADILTKYLKKLRNKVKQKNLQYIFSIAPAPYPFGLNEVLQDSDTWVKKGLVDFLCPQFYRSDFDPYKKEVNKLLQRGFSEKELRNYVPGIAFTANKKDLTASDIVRCVSYNRINGLGGQVFFFYEGLTANNKKIAKALKSSADYSKVATLPTPPFV